MDLFDTSFASFPALREIVILKDSGTDERDTANVIECNPRLLL
jgi:hypothetical protein